MSTRSPAALLLASLLATAIIPVAADSGLEDSDSISNPFGLSGGLGQALSVTWSEAAGFGFGSATGLDLSAVYQSPGISGRIGASATLLAGTKARELHTRMLAASQAASASPAGAAAFGLPDLVLAPGYPAGALPDDSQPDSLLALSLSEFYVKIASSSLAFSVGRMSVKAGQGRAFSPADLFAIFDRSAVIPKRLGVDVLELVAFPLPLATVRLAARPSATAPDMGSYSLRASSLIAESGDFSLTAAGGAAWSGLEKRWIIAPEIRIDTAFVTLYGEAAWRLPAGTEVPGSIDAMAGLDTSLAGFVLALEYGYDGRETEPSRLFGSLSRRLGDSGSIAASCTWIPASDYLAAAASLALDDIAGGRLLAAFSLAAIPGSTLHFPEDWMAGLSLALERAF